MVGLTPPLTTETELLYILRRCSSLGHLNLQEARDLLRNRTIRRYTRGEFIYLEGDILNVYSVIVQGTVRLIKQSPCGKAFTIATLHSTESLGDISVFNQSPVFVSAQAMKSTTLLNLDRVVFLETLGHNLGLTKDVIATVGKRVGDILERLMYILADKAEHRVCKVLSNLTTEYGDELPFTQQDIADIAGVTRETVSRTTCHMESLGLIDCHRGGIHIKDLPKLRSMIADGEYQSLYTHTVQRYG